MESSIQHFLFRVRHEILDTIQMVTFADSYDSGKPGSTARQSTWAV